MMTMAVARHGAGPTVAARALASQVHPVFMLPPLAVASFGAILAPTVSAPLVGVHLFAVFCAVYTAHVKDGLVDFHHRGEDDDHPLTVGGCHAALVGAVTAFLLAALTLWALAGVAAAVITVPLGVIGFLHAPQLDTTTAGATLGYPLGVVLAFVGGFVIQTGTVSVTVLGVAAVLFVMLAGIKIVDDTTDVNYDREIGKPTVAVVIGPTSARGLANSLFGTAVIGVLGLAVLGGVPPTGVVAGGAFAVVAVIANRATPEVATMLLVRGAYVFLAVLIAGLWFHPLT